jgi:hypothetical protein
MEKRDVVVEKKKFEALLTRMLASPPLPLADVKTKPRKTQRVKAK